MKRAVSTALAIAVVFLGTACHTAPKAKPLTELTEEQQLQMYMYAPAALPEKKGYDWDNIYRDTTLVLLCIPLLVIEGLAQSGAHFSSGK